MQVGAVAIRVAAEGATGEPPQRVIAEALRVAGAAQRPRGVGPATGNRAAGAAAPRVSGSAGKRPTDTIDYHLRGS